MPKIDRTVSINTGKNAGDYPSVASRYRTLVRNCREAPDLSPGRAGATPAEDAPLAGVLPLQQRHRLP